MSRLLACAGAALIVLPLPATAQAVFHSHQAANLPTAETLPAGAWLFEISHRFDTPLSEGGSALWGLDGPVLYRLGLTYSPGDAVMLGILRTNYEDNLELNAKVGVWEGGSDGIPVEVAVMGGVAWNTEATEFQGAEDNEMQLYVQLILNAMLADRLAVGLVPTYLRNPDIVTVDAENAFVLGLNGQVYLTDVVSFLGEWVMSEERPGLLTNDSATFGFEIETRGHFFKLLVTNQVRPNPTQHLAGAPTPFEVDEWRFGFNITRLLPF